MEQRGGQKCLDSPEFPIVVEEEQQWMAELCGKTLTRLWLKIWLMLLKMNRMINAKIAKLAADHYFLQNLTQEQRGELGKTIRNYQKDFLRYYHNPKLICKVLTILLVAYKILACPPFPH